MKRKIVDRPSGFEIAASLESFTSEYAYTGSPKTEAFYRNQLANLAAHLERAGVTLLADVTADMMRLYLKDQARSTYTRRGDTEPRTLARSSLIQRYAAARTFFQWCIDEGRLDISPMVNVKRPKEEHRIREALDREQFRLLVANAAAGPGWVGLRDKAILLVLLDTGARASELLGMTDRCIDWRTGQLVLHGKGRKDRVMDMAAETRRALRAYLQHPKRPAVAGGCIWVTLRRRPMGYGALNAMLHAMEGYANLDRRVTPHMLRHTFAAEFTRANLGNVKATKERLGHAKIATTEKYIESLGGGYGLGETFKTPASSWGIT